MDTETKALSNALKENAGVTVAVGVALTIMGLLAIMAPLFTEIGRAHV